MTPTEIEARLQQILDRTNYGDPNDGLRMFWHEDLGYENAEWIVDQLRASLKREAMMKKALEKYSTYPSDILYFDIDNIGNVINPHELVKNVQMPINIVARDCLAELEKE